MLRIAKRTLSFFAVLVSVALGGMASAQTHVYEIVEQSFTAQSKYKNAYIDE